MINEILEFQRSCTKNVYKFNSRAVKNSDVNEIELKLEVIFYSHDCMMLKKQNIY